MTVKLKRQYRHWIPGSVIELGDGICAELIRRGVAEEVVAKRMKAPPRDKMMTAPPRSK